MPKIAGARPRVKLMSHQQDILKKICCDNEGATGCAVSLGTAAQLLRLGLVHLAPTRAGIEYLTGEQILSPSQIENWVRGFKTREGKLLVREERKTRKQRELERSIQKAEEADKQWKARQAAAGRVPEINP